MRSFSATGNTTTALWINQNLAEDEANNDVSAVLKLRRVEPNEVAKTVEGRRLRKELAIYTVEEDIGLNSKTLQMDQIRSMAIRGEGLSGGCANPHINASSRKTSEGHLHISKDAYNCTTKAIPIHHVCYGSNDEKSVGFENSSSARTEEMANTDVAASVLLMLSR